MHPRCASPIAGTCANQTHVLAFAYFWQDKICLEPLNPPLSISQVGSSAKHLLAPSETVLGFVLSSISFICTCGRAHPLMAGATLEASSLRIEMVDGHASSCPSGFRPVPTLQHPGQHPHQHSTTTAAAVLLLLLLLLLSSLLVLLWLLLLLSSSSSSTAALQIADAAHIPDAWTPAEPRSPEYPEGSARLGT